MKILKTEFLIKRGEFPNSKEFETILVEIYKAISSIAWPLDSGKFTLLTRQNNT